jgi:predicted amidohydrolase
MMLLVGMTYTTVEQVCYNSAFLIAADGNIIGRYDKTHLLGNDTKFTAGTDLPVFATPYGLMGIMIGADRRWPEASRVLRVRGARVILNPSYDALTSGHEAWMRTHSYENECFVCHAHPTLSAVFDPPGSSPPPVYQSGAAGLTWGDLNLAGTTQVNHVMINARRPELYGPVAQV